MHLLSLTLPMLYLGVAVGQSDDPSYLGCFSDPAENRVFVWEASTSSMTAEACSALCSESDFYGTQYSQECWCGDNVGYAENGPGVCEMACTGNSDEICGGPYALSIYSNDPNYLGCWSDPYTADTRLFFTRIDVSEDMTTAVCDDLCAAYPLYGTQYGTECWCDDGTADYDQNGPAVCDYECAGSTDGELCGGFDAISIRSHDVIVVGNNSSSYLGCFSDPADNRIFALGASSDDMSAEMCRDLCAEYEFYGTQYSEQCWCGNNAEYDVNGVGVCDMACSGDSSELCGGSYAMSVYENDNVEVDPSYRGCFADTADNRVFHQTTSDFDLTTEHCGLLCSIAGFSFYGLQYSIQCWCGDHNTEYSANGDGVCDMPCGGDAYDMCGGVYSMDIYSIDPSYLGCFSDPAGSRIFAWEASSNDMTAETCATLCADSAFYGTQYSEECWCGDNADYDANGFGVCDMPCLGNPDEICGGSYAMSVHQTL